MKSENAGTTAVEGYTSITRGVRVTVRPEHLVEQSDPEQSVYAFAYTMRIENIGGETVQLLERHWLINSAGVQIAEVVGPGVVGEQPVLGPGDAFEYTSSAVIHDPIGSMEGTYTFKASTGQFFDVSIPRFDLVYPTILH